MVSPYTKTYMYSYDNEADFTFAFGSCYKATHASELPFLFPSLLRSCGLNIPAVSLLEQGLSEFMISSWTAFARYTDPNRRDPKTKSLRASSRQDSTFWVEFSNVTNPYTILNRQISQGENYRVEYCAFWDSNQLTPSLEELRRRRENPSWFV